MIRPSGVGFRTSPQKTSQRQRPTSIQTPPPLTLLFNGRPTGFFVPNHFLIDRSKDQPCQVHKKSIYSVYHLHFVSQEERRKSTLNTKQKRKSLFRVTQGVTSYREYSDHDPRNFGLRGSKTVVRTTRSKVSTKVETQRSLQKITP